MKGRHCVELGCGAESFSLGLCMAHFQEERARSWQMCAATTYQGVHAEIKRYLGAARNYPCADCGTRAEDWSYQGGARDERQGKYGPFSRDPSFYVPRCRSCHKTHDLAVGGPIQRKRPTHCRNGHPYEETNTYIAPSGGRSCRACMRRRSVARYRAAVGYNFGGQS